MVSYVLTGNQLRFRLPEYSEIFQYARGRQIRLSVVDVNLDKAVTKVVVTGVAYRDENQPNDGGVDTAEQWPTGVSTHLMCLDLTDIEGTTTHPGKPSHSLA